MQYLPQWCEARVEALASVSTLLPNSSFNSVGYCIEPIELGKHVSACPGCGITNGLRLRYRHISIGDSHLAGVVTFNAYWSGEFILGVRELNALNLTFGKPLLGDGFTLALSAVGDKELGSALLPDVNCTP